MNLQMEHDDALTGMAVGVLAATVAAVAHEAIGHGGGCAVVGGHVSLLTSIFFDCDGATALTDAGGPLGSLLAALVAALALRFTRAGTWLFPFLFLSFVINAGWFSGQLIYSAALDRDDWHYVAKGLHWPAAWRVAAIAIGVGLYWGSLRFLRGWTLDRSTLRRSYAAAAGSAALAGLFWSKAPFASAWEGVLAVGVAPLGFLFSAVRRSPPRNTLAALPRSWEWVGVSSVLYVLFLAVEARGIG
jgi:hypothetical protein